MPHPNFTWSKVCLYKIFKVQIFQDPNLAQLTILILYDLDYIRSKYCKIEVLWDLNNNHNISKGFTKTFFLETDKFVKTDCVPRMPRHCKNGNYIRAQRFIITVFHRSYYCQKLLEIQSCIERLKLWALRCARHNEVKFFL